jgi:acetoin utilization deacetylase AcuC-like enzyme
MSMSPECEPTPISGQCGPGAIPRRNTVPPAADADTVYCTDSFSLPLPTGHRFPMAKYGLIRAALANGPWGARLRFRTPCPVSPAQLHQVHCPDYVQRVIDGRLSVRQLERLGFPWSPQLVERSLRSAGGTLAAAQVALLSGFGVTLAGGTHHARADAAHGYCVFNDAAAALAVLRSAGQICRAVILDLDAHQGNGTARIFAHDPAMLTVSINEAPAVGRYAYLSDIDINMPRGTTDPAYLAAVSQALAEIDARPRADLVIYNAGVDPHAADQLGQLALTGGGLRQRDELVFGWCRRRGLPVAVTMGGGYMADAAALARLHANTVEAALRTYRGTSAPAAVSGPALGREAVPTQACLSS